MSRLPPTFRSGYQYFDALSAMQKHMRRGHIDEGCFFAAEFDLNGNGNATFARLMLYADEDINLADPLVGIYIGEQYKRWKAVLKKEKLNPSSSSKSMKARRILMETAYVTMRAMKTRIAATATTICQALRVEESEADPFLYFEEAMKEGDEYAALYWASYIHLWTKLPEDPKIEEWHDSEKCLGRPSEVFPRVFDILKRVCDPVYTDAVDRWFIMKTNGFRRLHLISAVLIALREPYLTPIFVNTSEVERLLIESYSEGTILEIPDYAYDKHTQKGRGMGRGLKHFWEVGSKVKKRGYPDDYKPAAVAFYDAVERLERKAKSKKIREAVRRGEWILPKEVMDMVDNMLRKIGVGR